MFRPYLFETSVILITSHRVINTIIHSKYRIWRRPADTTTGAPRRPRNQRRTRRSRSRSTPAPAPSTPRRRPPRPSSSRRPPSARRRRESELAVPDHIPIGQNELFSGVWKLSSQSCTDVPAQLPSAMLPRQARQRWGRSPRF